MYIAWLLYYAWIRQTVSACTVYSVPARNGGVATRTAPVHVPKMTRASRDGLVCQTTEEYSRVPAQTLQVLRSTPYRNPRKPVVFVAQQKLGLERKGHLCNG